MPAKMTDSFDRVDNPPDTRRRDARPAASAGCVRPLRRRAPRALALLLPLMLAVMPGAPALAAGAQDAADVPIRFKHLSMAEGLSQNTVLTMHQDSTGFLWFGTENGLNRYDGYTFRAHQRNRQDPTALQDDWILDIDEDPAGNLWVATKSGGVSMLDRTTGHWRNYLNLPGRKPVLADNDTRTIVIARDGSVLIGTKSGGIDRLDPAAGTVTRNYRDFDGDPATGDDDAVYAILQGAGTQDQVFVGTDAGVFRLDLASGLVGHVPLDGPDVAVTHRIRALLRDRQGRLWVGTRDAGVYVLGATQELLMHFVNVREESNSLAHNDVYALHQDRSGRIWVATRGGLNLYRPASRDFARYEADTTNPTSLPNSRLTSIIEDRSGLLWVGTQTGGASYFNPRSWAFGHYLPAAGGESSARVVTSFAETTEGRLWMGTFGDGIHELSRNALTGQITRDEPISIDLGDRNVMAMTRGGDGRIWVGLMRGGLRHVDPDTGAVESWKHDPADPASLSDDSIMAVFEDSRGVLWAGTYGAGLNRLAPDGTIRRITTEQGLSHNVATVITEDAAGRIWVGTDGGGLNLLDGDGRVKAVFRTDPSAANTIASNSVYSLLPDGGSVLWIGGKSGLDQMITNGADPQGFRFRNFSKRDGLSNNTVFGILPDRSGQLWLSTNYGITRLNPAEGTSRSFHQEHGLQGEDFNFGAYLGTSDGALCFGGGNGFNAFYPDRLQLNQLPPPTVLTSVTRLNQPVETPLTQLSALDLAYSDDVVAFEFAALDFAAPERNHYAYMLEGFDSDWVYKGPVHRVTYTNLDRGRYVFRVRSRNSDGFWSEEGIALPIVVEAAPWETWWAYLGYALLAFGVICLALRSQHVKLQREAQYRTRLEHEVSERTQELADRAEELKTLNEKLKESSFTDPLTGLHNRRFLFEGIAGEISEICARHDETTDTTPDELVFVMVDLDHFKPVNDSYGHAAGDSLLLQITQLLKDACREGDWVIRWGGDEFLVVGRLRPGDDPEHLVARLSGSVANALFPVGNGRVARTTTSIGFARFPFVKTAPRHLSWEQVLNVADHAMYAAKEQRNTYVGYEATAKTLLCDDLLLAISRDVEELVEDGMLAVRTPPEPARSARQQSA